MVPTFDRNTKNTSQYIAISNRIITTTIKIASQHIYHRSRHLRFNTVRISKSVFCVHYNRQNIDQRPLPSSPWGLFGIYLPQSPYRLCWPRSSTSNTFVPTTNASKYGTFQWLERRLFPLLLRCTSVLRPAFLGEENIQARLQQQLTRNSKKRSRESIAHQNLRFSFSFDEIKTSFPLLCDSFY
jgi:hypothetical protein